MKEKGMMSHNAELHGNPIFMALVSAIAASTKAARHTGSVITEGWRKYTNMRGDDGDARLHEGQAPRWRR